MPLVTSNFSHLPNSKIISHTKVIKNSSENQQISHCVTKESSNTNPFFLEWQLWKGINRLNSSSNLIFDMKINDQKIIINNFDVGSSNGEKQVVNGLKYNLDKKWISQKILSIKLFLRVSTSNSTVINLPKEKSKVQ